MKKVFLLLCITTALLFLSGCGSNSTLECTMNKDGVDINFNIGFVGNKIETIDLKYIMDYSEYSDKQIKELNETNFCEKVKSTMEDLKDSFENCKQTFEDKKLNITGYFDLNKIDSKSLSKIQSPTSAKKELENSGYKCSIKK